jgi:hypothetical protein
MNPDPELQAALQAAPPITAEPPKIAAFIEPASVVSGLALRPFTAGTLAQLMMVGNKLIEKTEDQSDIAFHVLGFLYVHAGPVAEVRRSVMERDKFVEAVWKFADTVTVKDFVSAADAIRAIIERGMVGMDYEVVASGEPQSPN